MTSPRVADLRDAKPIGGAKQRVFLPTVFIVLEGEVDVAPAERSAASVIAANKSLSAGALSSRREELQRDVVRITEGQPRTVVGIDDTSERMPSSSNRTGQVTFV
jgi:hypothetical protein